MRRCDACGGSLEGRDKRAKFCDAKCRVRYGRGHRAPAVVVDLPFTAPEPVADDNPLTLEEIAAELRTTLRRSDTPASAKAGLARELRATMAEIEARKPVAKDGIDELLDRRNRRTS